MEMIAPMNQTFVQRCSSYVFVKRYISVRVLLWIDPMASSCTVDMCSHHQQVTALHIIAYKLRTKLSIVRYSGIKNADSPPSYNGVHFEIWASHCPDIDRKVPFTIHQGTILLYECN